MWQLVPRSAPSITLTARESRTVPPVFPLQTLETNSRGWKGDSAEGKEP